MRPAAGLLTFLLLTALAACAGLRGSIDPPRVHLSDVGLLKPGLFEQRLRVDLRLVNPNDVDLTLDGLTFELAVNDEHLADGVSGQRVDIPRFGDATVTLEASATVLAMLRQIMALGQRETITYRISGKAYFDAPWRRAVPYEQRGELRVLPAPGPDELRHLQPLETGLQTRVWPSGAHAILKAQPLRRQTRIERRPQSS